MAKMVYGCPTVRTTVKVKWVLFLVSSSSCEVKIAKCQVQCLVKTDNCEQGLPTADTYGSWSNFW